MSRVRSTTISYPQPVTITTIYPNGTTFTNNVGNDMVSISKTMTDEKTIGYFGKSRKGQFLPINPMSQSYKTVVSNSGVSSWVVRYNGVIQYTLFIKGPLAYTWRATSTRLFPAWVGSTVSWPSTSTAVTSSLANARTRGFDVLTFMAEFSKTVELISKFRDRTLNRAQRIADSLPRRNLKDPVSAFADTWLEGRYGWRLLAFDIESINEALTRLASFRTPFTRGYETLSNTASATMSNYSTPSSIFQYYKLDTQAAEWGYGTGSTTQTLTRSVHAGTVLEAIVTDALVIDPLVTTWEIIPFSFIVDWFTNIGDIIAAYSPFATENVLGSWATSKEELVTRSLYQTATKPTGSFTYTLDGPSQSCFLESSQVTKTRVTASPSANLSFKVNLDGLKVTDLVSIFFQRWGGTLRGLLKHNRI